MNDRQLRQLVESYQPNPAVVEQLKKVIFVAVVGATSSGKTTIINKLLKTAPDIKPVISETSRPVRPGEKDGQELFFRTKADMIDDLKHGRLVQVLLSPYNEFYGTSPQNYPASGIGVMPVFSYVILAFRSLPFKKMHTAFIVPENYQR